MLSGCGNSGVGRPGAAHFPQAVNAHNYAKNLAFCVRGRGHIGCVTGEADVTSDRQSSHVTIDGRPRVNVSRRDETV